MANSLLLEDMRIFEQYMYMHYLKAMYIQVTFRKEDAISIHNLSLYTYAISYYYLFYFRTRT